MPKEEFLKMDDPEPIFIVRDQQFISRNHIGIFDNLSLIVTSPLNHYIINENPNNFLLIQKYKISAILYLMMKTFPLLSDVWNRKNTVQYLCCPQVKRSRSIEIQNILLSMEYCEDSNDPKSKRPVWDAPYICKKK